jgi:hypothetical protein
MTWAITMADGVKSRPQWSQRSGAGQQQVHHEAGHDGRQTHEGIEQGDQQTPPGETEQRHGGAQRQPEKRGHEHGGQAHL